MESLKNKIDFAVILSVKNANPNGDPLNGNRPRANYDGYGEISDVCLKRKIRNRLMEMKNENGEFKYQIFVQSDDNRLDDYRSLKSRVEGEIKKEILKDEKKFRDEACKKWIDVRAFGQVFAYSGGKKNKKPAIDGNDEDKKGDNKGVSIGIRGPVSIHPAFSVIPIDISSNQIIKSVNGEKDGPQKASDTMGMKHRVDYGVYIFYGSINPQLASKTGFSDDDAEAIRLGLIELFENDASSARPEGSMEVKSVYWWKHNCKNGQYSSAKVHRSLKVTLKPHVSEAKNIEDYDIQLEILADLIPKIHTVC